MQERYKILLISDEPIFRKYPIDKIKEIGKGIDFILSAGDLGNDYLDFVYSVLNKPLIYVNGNHVYHSDHDISFLKNCDQKSIKFKNLKIFGLDGSPFYAYRKHQYTEKDVFMMIIKNAFNLFIRKPDIVLSHAPPRGIHDKNDVIHTGFENYHLLLKYFKPKLWVHGHVHLEHHHKVQESVINGTRFVNAYGYKIIEFEVK